jgi:hypothetical protein
MSKAWCTNTKLLYSRLHALRRMEQIAVHVAIRSDDIQIACESSLFFLMTHRVSQCAHKQMDSIKSLDRLRLL